MKILKTFEQTGSVTKQKKSCHPHTARSAENLQSVEESVDTKAFSTTEHLNKSTAHAHRAFSLCVLEMQAADNNFYNKIIMSDEANFYLNGYVNHRNCGI